MEPWETETETLKRTRGFKSETCIWNLGEPELFRVEPLCGTWWNLNFSKWNHYVEPCGTSTFKSGTFMRNLVEPELLTVEPLCGTLWTLNFEQWNLYVEPGGTWTFKSGTCMRNLAEPGPRFRAPPNHPEAALLEEPQAFQAVGEKSYLDLGITAKRFNLEVPNVSTAPEQGKIEVPNNARVLCLVLKVLNFIIAVGVFTWAYFLKPLNHVRPVSGTFVWNLLNLMWNLDPKPLCGTSMRDLYVKLLSRTFRTPVCKTFMWNLSLEPWKLYLWNLGTCKCETFMWNVPLCGTWALRV